MAKIPAYTELTSPNQNDLLVIEDSVASATKKIKLGNLIGVQGVGYTAVGATPNTVTANGNRSYTCVFNSTDLSGFLSSGMRLRTTRTISAPTQCTSLNGTSQYYSKSSPAGMTFTDDFVVSAWVKLNAYNGAANQVIAGRYNGTSGYELYITTSGQVALVGYNAGAANFSQVASYQSLPLNKWVHVSAQLDMSAYTATTTTSYTMIDGVDVPATVTRGGTNPTALVQAGNLEIGSDNGGARFFNGKIAQVAIYNAKVTQATILASMNQGLSGSETSLISAYSFNNTINDLSANANNLTANGAAVATNADSPFGTQASGLISATLDYGIIQSVTFSTNTTLVVQVPEGCTIPTSGGVSAVSYSTQKAPYGFPVGADKWSLITQNLALVALGTTTSTWYGGNVFALKVPTGAWRTSYSIGHYVDRTTTADYRDMYASLSTGASSASDASWTEQAQVGVLAATGVLQVQQTHTGFLNVASATSYYGVVSTNGTTTGQALVRSYILIENAYL